MEIKRNLRKERVGIITSDKMDKKAFDKKVAYKLWKISEVLTGIKF